MTAKPARLSLRSRVLIGFSAIAAIAVIIAVAVTVTTHHYMVRQLDDKLSSFAGRAPIDQDPNFRPQPPHDADLDPDARPSDVLRGFIDTDGLFTVYFAPNVEGADAGIPAITMDSLPANGDVYLNAPSTDEDTDFRVYVRATDRGWDITAVSLDDVQSTTQRLILIEVIGIVAMLAGLALIAWWVIRLGIAPMRRMVDASTKIAQGDMAVRLDGQGGSAETAQLADSLNAMIGTLTMSLAQRERSEARLREFVADASHELRTPLTTILGYSELFRRGALSKKADATDAWARTEAEAARMHRLVKDMLELAKYDAEPTLNAVELDLTALVREVVADAVAAHPGTAFAVEASGRSSAQGDPDKLRQALINVVANAAEHGGAHVTVSVAEASEDCTITVTDDGSGMDGDLADRAAERFVRGDSSRTRSTGGAGLGLAITSAIIQAHGGTLTIDSDADRGTAVTIGIPRSLGQAQREASHPTQ